MSAAVSCLQMVGVNVCSFQTGRLDLCIRAAARTKELVQQKRHKVSTLPFD